MSDRSSSSFSVNLWEQVGKLPGVVVICGVLYGALVWGIGPVKPQSAIDLDAQKTATTALAADLAKQISALTVELNKQTSQLAADQAARASALATDIAALKASPGGSLRQQDITDWTGHLAQLDGKFDAQRDKITQAQYDIKDLQQKYQTLVAPPRK